MKVDKEEREEASHIQILYVLMNLDLVNSV